MKNNGLYLMEEAKMILIRVMDYEAETIAEMKKLDTIISKIEKLQNQ